MLSRETCDAMRAGRLPDNGDDPVASIGRDGIVFGAGFSANVCMLQTAREVQGRLEGRFACADEQDTRETITLSLALQGRRLTIRRMAPNPGRPETWWFCSPLDPAHSVVSGGTAVPSPPPPAAGPSAPAGGLNVEQRALAALAEELRDATEFGGGKPQTKVTPIDLNGDGQPDALVTITSSYYGARGCQTEIIEIRPDGARRIGSALTCALRPAGRGPAGWLDLTGGGSKVWRHDGSVYR